MKDIVESLNRIIIEETGNPTVRFILKSNIEEQKIKAYKKLSSILYLHTPGKNIECLNVSQTFNTAGILPDNVKALLEPYFYYEILKWVKSEEFDKLVNTVKEL